MQHTVIGTANQCIVTQMALSEEIRADSDSLVLLSDGVALEAIPNAPLGAGSLLPIVGSTVPLTHFRCMASLGVVMFAAPCIGETRKLEIRGSTWMCARDSFLFCSQDVITTIGLAQPVATGYFQKNGFVLFRLSGHGEAYIHCGGSVIEYDLAPGQRVSVDAGCVAAYQELVQPAVEALDVAPGEGPLYLITLTGPGRIDPCDASPVAYPKPLTWRRPPAEWNAQLWTRDRTTSDPVEELQRRHGRRCKGAVRRAMPVARI